MAEHAYYPFGAEMSANPTEAPREALRFTGHERDDLNEIHTLDYMLARYYNAAVGRLLSIDPLNGDPSAPQSWNRYAYAVNSPLMFTDPFGMYPCIVSAPEVNGGKPFQSDCTDYVIPQYQQDVAEWNARNRVMDLDLKAAQRQRLPDGMQVDRMAQLRAQANAGDEWAMMLLHYPASAYGIQPTYDEFWLITGAASLIRGIGFAAGARAFTPDQRALIALAKELRRAGASPEEAKIMLQWAKEYGVAALDHTAPEEAAHWVGGPHIRIGPINHIRVGP